MAPSWHLLKAQVCPRWRFHGSNGCLSSSPDSNPLLLGSTTSVPRHRTSTSASGLVCFQSLCKANQDILLIQHELQGAGQNLSVAQPRF
jgi:hypothetical protein